MIKKYYLYINLMKTKIIIIKYIFIKIDHISVVLQ